VALVSNYLTVDVPSAAFALSRGAAMPELEVYQPAVTWMDARGQVCPVIDGTAIRPSTGLGAFGALRSSVQVSKPRFGNRMSGTG
jgi:predicted lipoprotein